jgi:hypothetical protein
MLKWLFKKFTSDNLWEKQEINHDLHEFIRFAKTYSFFSKKKPLIGKVSKSLEDFQITCTILTLIDKCVNDPLLRSIASAEVLCKVLAYRDLKANQKIIIPLLSETNQPIKAIYRVNKIFDLWQGMPAFGLCSDSIGSTPILLFRGTDMSLKSKRSFFSFLSDLDPSGPGLNTFFNGRDALHKWLEKHKKARVMGFSLGGILAAYTALFEHNLISMDKHNPSFSFNAPGASQKIFSKWTDLKNKPPLLTFTTKNDFIPKLGKTIGSEFYEIAADKMTPLKAHVTLITASSTFYLYPK